MKKAWQHPFPAIFACVNACIRLSFASLSVHHLSYNVGSLESPTVSTNRAQHFCFGEVSQVLLWKYKKRKKQKDVTVTFFHVKLCLWTTSHGTGKYVLQLRSYGKLIMQLFSKIQLRYCNSKSMLNLERTNDVQVPHFILGSK